MRKTTPTDMMRLGQVQTTNGAKNFHENKEKRGKMRQIMKLSEFLKIR